MFKHLLEKISEPAKLMVTPSEYITQQRAEYPTVPKEYFVFLEEVGWGNIGGMMMYRGLLDPNDILGPIDEPWVGIAIFGDNWQGSSFGFDLENGELVEITPAGEVESVDLQFPKFITDYSN